jgi:heme/copper-type cytochrome/quinol oxidase subunit 2
MIEEKFTEEVIKKIKEEKISPKPRWLFFLKNNIIWIMGMLSVIFGAVSFSLIIYLFEAGETLTTGNFGGSFWEIFLTIIPIFWLFFLGLFIFLAYLNLRKTKKGYKYSTSMIFFSSIFISMILGTMLYMFGVGQKFDDLLGRRVHPFFYRNFMNPHINFWSNPEEGRLSGIISEIKNDNSVILVDADFKEWKVVFADNFLNINIRLKENMPVKFFGQKIGIDEFTVFEVLPIGPGEEFFNNPDIRKKMPPRDHVPDTIPRP